MIGVPSKPSPVPVHHATHDHVESASVPGGARLADDDALALAAYAALASLGGAA